MVYTEISTSGMGDVLGLSDYWCFFIFSLSGLPVYFDDHKIIVHKPMRNGVPNGSNE
jgi:hypothetical protein